MPARFTFFPQHRDLPLRLTLLNCIVSTGLMASGSLTLTVEPSGGGLSGHGVTLRASVFTPEGDATVTFFDGSENLGTARVLDGHATLLTTRIRPGSRLLSASCINSSQSSCGSATKTITIEKQEAQEATGQISRDRSIQQVHGRPQGKARPGDGNLVFSLGAASITVGAMAGSGSVLLSGAGSWTAVSNSPWLHVAPAFAAGQGGAAMPFSYDANPAPTTQSGSITIAGLTLSVIQAGNTDVVVNPLNPLIVSALVAPSGVAVDLSGNVYVADTGNNSVEEWSPATQQLSVILPQGQVLNPGGVAVDAAGNIYVADTGNGAVKEWIVSTQTLTTLASGLIAPKGVALDAQGNLYFTDAGGNSLSEWVAATGQLTTLVTSGVSNPTGVAVDLLGNVYIADSGNNAVEEWSPTSQTLTPLISGLASPTSVAVDGQGNLSIADSGSSTVKQWNASTLLLTTIPVGAFLQPLGVAVDQFGELYIADTGNNAVDQLTFVYLGPGPFSEGALGGTDTFHVVPATTGFSASVDQGWLGLTGTVNGVTTFTFAPNQSVTSRAGNISVLGQQLPVFQLGDTPSYLTKSAGDSQSALPLQVFANPLQVVVSDSAGNPVAGAAVTFVVAAGNNGASATFPSGVQYGVNTDNFGTASTPQLTANGSAGSFSVTVSTANLSASFTLSNIAAGLSTTSELVGSGGGNGGVFLNLSSPNAPWIITTNAAWIHSSPANTNGVGSGLVQFTFDANPGPTALTGTVTIDGQIFTVTEAPAGSVQTEIVNSLIGTGLDLPFGVAADRQGNLYIADTGRNAIQKWTASTQQLTPLMTAGLNAPHGVAVDSAGNIYIADAYNNAVKEWIAASGVVTTLVSSGLKFPLSVAVDVQGNVYIADFGNNAVKQWSPVSGVVTTVVGSGLNSPTGVAVDLSGNVYVADFLNSTIKQWNPVTNQLTPILSTGLNLPNSLTVDALGNVFFIDGNNNAVKQWQPGNQMVTTLVSSGVAGSFGVATDSQGNVYLASPGTSTIQSLITAYLKLSKTAVTEGAKAGSDSVLATVLPASAPLSAAADQPWLTAGAIGGGTVNFSFLANTSVLSRIAHLTILGQAVTVTQSGDIPAALTKSAGDGQSAFAGQPFSTPLQAIVLDASGSPVQGAIVTFAVAAGPTGASGTFLVNGAQASSASVVTDVNGNAVSPTLTANSIGGLFSVGASSSGASANYTLTSISGTLGINAATGTSAAGAGSVLLVIGSPWTATANASWLHLAANSSSGSGNATIQYTFDANPNTQLRTGTITIAGVTFTVTQLGTSYLSLSGIGTLVSTGLKSPQGNAVDSQGNVYIADTANNAVKEWSAATKLVTTLASGLNGPSAVALDTHGNVYFSDSNSNLIKEWIAATQVVSTITFLGLSHPYGVAVDTAGNLYVADYGHNAIKKLTPTGAITTLVSTGISQPRGVALDAAGNVYFDDSKNNAVKEWNAATGVVTSLVSTSLNVPSAVAVDGQGNVYIADTNNNFVKRWNPATLAVTTLTTPGLKGPGGVALDALGNVYIVDTGNSALKEYSVAYLALSANSRTEPAAAGSDSVTALVWPTNTPLTPVSDQTWLTFTGLTNGVVGFTFTANNTITARTAHLYILAQPVTITQNADIPYSMTRTTGTGQSVAVGIAYPTALQVRIKDQSGGIVKGVSVTYTVTAGANGASGTFPGNVASATVVSDSNGLATAPVLTANAIAGTFTVKAIAASLNAVFNLTITSH